MHADFTAWPSKADISPGTYSSQHVAPASGSEVDVGVDTKGFPDACPSRGSALDDLEMPGGEGDTRLDFEVEFEVEVEVEVLSIRLL